MILTLWNGQSFDTEKDLTAAEPHVLQKLFIWESMAKSLESSGKRRSERFKWVGTIQVPSRGVMP